MGVIKRRRLAVLVALAAGVATLEVALASAAQADDGGPTAETFEPGHL
jgi:hypothetical protein